jgi:DNA polymerase-3 subunit gamma/tau
VPDAWEQTVKSQVKPLVRALYSAGSFVGNRGDVWLFSVPNEAHGAKCNDHRPAVEAALAAAVGSPVSIEFVTGGARAADAESTRTPAASAAPTSRPSRPDGPSSPAPAGSSSSSTSSTSSAPSEPEPDSEPEPHVPEADEDVDLHALTDAPPESVKTPIDRLADAFPGSELLADG